MVWFFIGTCMELNPLKPMQTTVLSMFPTIIQSPTNLWQNIIKLSDQENL